MTDSEYINADCFKYFKKVPDESIDLICTDAQYGISFDASFHMDNADWDKMSDQEYEKFLDTFFAECKRVLKPTGTLWFFYGITKIETVIKCVNRSGMFNHWENAMVYTSQNKTYQAFHLTINNKNYIFNQVEIKRDVVVPYMVKKDGKRIKRGWDYENGKPKRWTGIGNCLYAPNFEFLIQILSVLSSKENDTVLFNNKYLKRDYNLLFNKISSSEDCPLHFSKRLFLPKL